MRNRKHIMTVFVAAFVAVAAAQSALPAAAIVKRAEANEKDASSVQLFEMTVRETSGREPRLYRILLRSRGDEESMVEFLEPRTIRGLRVLSLGDESWVFFPSTGRTRKISGASRSGSVQGVGGDFSYEDLASDSWSKDYAFSIYGEDGTTWTLEGKPTKTGSTYNAIRMTIEKVAFRTRRVEYSSASKGYFKTLTFGDFKPMGGKTRATVMEMSNLASGSRTSLVLIEATYDQAIDDRWFSPERFAK